MNLICPLCNGLQSMSVSCRECRGSMVDWGRLEDFYTPYSPYEEQDDLLRLQEGIDYCPHLFYCADCGSDQRVWVPLLDF